MALGAKQKELLKKLEDISNRMDTLLEDETVASLTKAYNRIKEDLGDLIQAVEDGDFQEEPEEEEEDGK